MSFTQLETKIWVAQHGFQLRDAASEWGGSKTFANHATFVEDTVGVVDGVVGLTDVSRAAGLIPVIVELLDTAPSDDDIADYDGVVDAPLELKSGVLRLEGDVSTFQNGVPETPTLHLTVVPGSYRVRVHYANNDTSRYDYADGADHVRLSLWPAPPAPLAMRKKKVSEDDPVKEYRGPRSKKELMAYLRGPSISHRCLAVVALTRMGDVGPLTDALESNPFDSVLAVYLAALGFAGKKALSVIEEQSHEDRDLKLRLVQTLRLVGGAKAKKMAEEIAEGSEFSTIADALEDFE